MNIKSSSRLLEPKWYAAGSFLAVPFTVCSMPNVRCGQRVHVGEARGVIVGHNESANFSVLFDLDSPKYPGAILSVHPGELVLATAPQ